MNLTERFQKIVELANGALPDLHASGLPVMPACYAQPNTAALGSDGNIKEAMPDATPQQRLEFFTNVGRNGMASILQPFCKDLGEVIRLAWVCGYSQAARWVSNDNTVSFDKVDASLFFRAHNPDTPRPIGCTAAWYRSFRSNLSAEQRRQIGGVVANDAASTLVLAELA